MRRWGSKSDAGNTVKMIVVGDQETGKTSIVKRLTAHSFVDDTKHTIGAEFSSKRVLLSDEVEINLQIWDTAGQERFRTITSSYYRGAHGIIIVYDVTDMETFNNVKTWLSEIEKYATDSVNKLLVGNKCDLVVKKAVDYNTAKDFADTLGIPFLETSAKNATNVEQAFMTMSSEIKRRIQSNPDPGLQRRGVNVGQGEKVAQKKKGGCC
eukprot:Hpha_TRINITY_DN15765_c1_g1::TRINITY_DN15765_c1_g1_i4::g.39616::m.39616/K07874/RAB1A; Ras-related protein Rab-1A